MVPERRVGLGSGTSKMKGGAKRKIVAAHGVARKAKRLDQGFEKRLARRLTPTGKKIAGRYHDGSAGFTRKYRPIVKAEHSSAVTITLIRVGGSGSFARGRFAAQTAASFP